MIQDEHLERLREIKKYDHEVLCIMDCLLASS